MTTSPTRAARRIQSTPQEPERDERPLHVAVGALGRLGRHLVPLTCRRARFNSVWQSLFPAGLHADGLVHRRTSRFSASWTEEAELQRLRRVYGLTREDFDAKNATFTAQGLRVDHLIGHMVNGAPRFAAIWIPSGANRQITISESGGQYQDRVPPMTGSGCRFAQAQLLRFGFVRGRLGLSVTNSSPRTVR
jgi:hypothetical protein